MAFPAHRYTPTVPEHSDIDDVRIDTDGELFDRIVAALEAVRPAIRADGGDVRLVEVEDESIAIVELSGACVGCPMSEMTLRYTIEAHLRTVVPEVLAVDVTSEHSVPLREVASMLERATFKPL